MSRVPNPCQHGNLNLPTSTTCPPLLCYGGRWVVGVLDKGCCALSIKPNLFFATERKLCAHFTWRIHFQVAVKSELINSSIPQVLKFYWDVQILKLSISMNKKIVDMCMLYWNQFTNVQFIITGILNIVVCQYCCHNGVDSLCKIIMDPGICFKYYWLFEEYNVSSPVCFFLRVEMYCSGSCSPNTQEQTTLFHNQLSGHRFNTVQSYDSVSAFPVGNSISQKGLLWKKVYSRLFIAQDHRTLEVGSYECLSAHSLHIWHILFMCRLQETIYGFLTYHLNNSTTGPKS